MSCIRASFVASLDGEAEPVRRGLHQHEDGDRGLEAVRPCLHRPCRARAIETVKAIIEAAARIVEGEGRAGLSTNAVAERAGVSIGSLCQYSPDWEALLGSLIGRETAMRR